MNKSLRILGVAMLLAWGFAACAPDGGAIGGDGMGPDQSNGTAMDNDNAADGNANAAEGNENAADDNANAADGNDNVADGNDNGTDGDGGDFGGADCTNNGNCVDDDCVCPDCANDFFCADPENCFDNGDCNTFTEGCVCADCMDHPACQN